METSSATIKKLVPLIVTLDDDPDFNILMEHRLNMVGCRVLTNSTIENFLHNIQKEVPKVVLIDLNLGGQLEGFELIKKLKNEMNVDYPIVVCSAVIDNNTITRALEVGASDFLTKPAFKNSFFDKLSRYISTEQLPKTELQTAHLIKVASIHQRSLLEFKVRVAEVGPFGFLLASQNLIRKGTVFKLRAKIIEEIFSNIKEIILTVTMVTVSEVNTREYLIETEVDLNNQDHKDKLQAFLSKMKNLHPPRPDEKNESDT